MIHTSNSLLSVTKGNCGGRKGTFIIHALDTFSNYSKTRNPKQINIISYHKIPGMELTIEHVFDGVRVTSS